jgi:hypothetical protein
MTVISGEPPVTEKRDTTILWIAGVSGTIVLLLLATQAFDVLLLLILCGIAFLLERTAGDWLADVLGPVGSKVLFVGGVILGTIIMLSFGSVRDVVWLGLAKADDAGFHSVLIDHLSTMPAADPVSGDGSSNDAPRNTGRPASSSPGGGGSAGSRSPASASEGRQPVRQPVVSTRSVLRLGGQGGSVHFAVDVITSGPPVDEGSVEFSIDGKRVGSARVSAGRAELRVGGVTSGPHRASARFLGTSRFGESVSESAFSR